MADGKVTIDTTLNNKGVTDGIKGLKKQLGGIGGAIGGLGKAFAALKAASFLIEFGKATIEVASDLQEVQNVVDTAFGDMAYKVEEFASTSIEQFGMSELTAKRTASTYMAMGKGLGLMGETAAQMSIQATKLTGDMASFYNISQDVADTALQSIWTGETESLKKFGVVMTQTNLQQFAYSRGVKANIADMSQAELVMLRYQYVTEKLGMVQGDFAKTSGTWANQTRILTEKWKEFMGLLGNGLITVLTPVVQFLNYVLDVLIKIAEAIGWLATNVFGIQSALDDTGKGTTDLGDSAGDAADQEKDLADGIEAAGEQAEKALAPFDKLNILQNGLSGGKGEGLNFDLPDLAGDIADAMDDIANKKYKIDVEANPHWGGTLPPLGPISVEVVPELATLPSPVFQPEWGLEPPPVPAPEIAPLPSPIYQPEWGLVESLTPELALVNQLVYELAYELAYALNPVFQEVWQPAFAYSSQLCEAWATNIITSTANAGANVKQNAWEMACSVLQNVNAMAMGSANAADVYASNVSTAVYETAKNIIENTGIMAKTAYENTVNFVNASSEAFAVWGNSVLDSVYQTAVGMQNSFLSGLGSMWKNFVSFMSGVGEKVSSFYAENKELIARCAIAAGIGIVASALVIASGGLAAPIAAGAVGAGSGVGTLALLPALATGAVIPPNNEFLALLGDQKSGTNIEAPLSTIEDAVRRVLSEGGYGGAQELHLTVSAKDGFTRNLKFELDRIGKLQGKTLVRGV